MKEKTPSFREQPIGGGAGSLFDSDPGNDQVRVVSGFHDQPLSVANRTVGEIRSRFRDRLEIDPQSQAVLDGHPADEETRVRPGQVLTFLRPGGEKGRSTRGLRGANADAQPCPSTAYPVRRPTLPGLRIRNFKTVPSHVRPASHRRP